MGGETGELERPEIVKRTLKCVLTNQERVELANRQSQAIEELASQKEELDTIKAQYKAKITALEGEVAGSARIINAGYQMKNVDCRVYRDFNRRVVMIFRQDTDPEEMVEQRAMTTDELQRKLFKDKKEDGQGDN
jgi:hypothetical protein